MVNCSVTDTNEGIKRETNRSAVMFLFYAIDHICVLDIGLEVALNGG